ncbi:alpha/beta fold hydrolase [Streptomyces sp. MJM1172]|uniref:alpha/beta fold hydrolase n=1 Tax=Streptomyces sp. MJM1172 TaxID=1703926 RepID=UPI0013010347|nr:alpha/beta hydrolase [Streptomyces sp. MJM1172]
MGSRDERRVQLSVPYLPQRRGQGHADQLDAQPTGGAAEVQFLRPPRRTPASHATQGHRAAQRRATTTGVANVNGTSLYHEAHGAGRPLVFLHGWGPGGRVWDAQAAGLSRDHHLITVDCRGCGRSERAATGYTIAVSPTAPWSSWTRWNSTHPC